MAYEAPAKRRARYAALPLEKKEALRADARRRYHARKDTFTPEFLAARAERERQWKRDNPERYKKAARRAHLKRRYGIALETYERLYAEQQGNCAVCIKWQPTLDVDHDHETGELRGLLCHRCNWALGILGDTHEHVNNVIKYLNKGK